MKQSITLALLVVLGLAAAGLVFAQEAAVAQKMEAGSAEMANSMNEEAQEAVNTIDDEAAPGDASAPVEANEVK